MVTTRTRLRRRSDRGHHDRDVLYAILDEALVAHVGFTGPDGPVVIPTAFARHGDALILHAAAVGRFGQAMTGPVCVTVTLLDGLVLARSAFHHAMNYRSVMVFGTPRLLDDPTEKRAALDALTDKVAPGRSRVARPPTDAERDATAVVALALDEASAKIRTGPPVDAPADLAWPAWAGVVPLTLAPGAPVRAPDVDPELAAPGVVESRHAGCLLSTDPGRLDVDAIHRFLSEEAYWSLGVPRDVVARALAGSICVGAYAGAAQVGLVRVVTDRATFAWVCDVFVLPSHRGAGLATAMMRLVRGLPELQGLRRWSLGTRDAHALYAGLGFAPLAAPTRFMEIVAPYR